LSLDTNTPAACWDICLTFPLIPSIKYVRFFKLDFQGILSDSGFKSSSFPKSSHFLRKAFNSGQASIVSSKGASSSASSPRAFVTVKVSWAGIPKTLPASWIATFVLEIPNVPMFETYSLPNLWTIYWTIESLILGSKSVLCEHKVKFVL